MTSGKVRLFEGDTMSADERFLAAVRLGEPDRVPLSLMLYHFAPRYAKESFAACLTHRQSYQRAMQKVWCDLGPWDLYYNVNPVSRLGYSYATMMRTLWPGFELPNDQILQIDEQSYMKAEDYQWALARPRAVADVAFRVAMLPRFCQEAKTRNRPHLVGKLLLELGRQIAAWRRDFSWWRSQGAAVQIGFQAEMPFDTFSQARSIVDFSIDLLRNPQIIGDAALHLAHSYANTAIGIAKLVGVPAVQCYCHRSSNSFISPEQFRTLAFPSLAVVVDRIVAAGMTPLLHCDGDWLRNLPILRQLPAGKVVLELDGSTDIFAAKKQIGDRMCLLGDVPAAKLVTGSASEVEEYCHRLIEEVGRGGGFILGAGCEIPSNARPDNVHAMVTAVRKYGRYRG